MTLPSFSPYGSLSCPHCGAPIQPQPAVDPREDLSLEDHFFCSTCGYAEHYGLDAIEEGACEQIEGIGATQIQRRGAETPEMGTLRDLEELRRFVSEVQQDSETIDLAWYTRQDRHGAWWRYYLRGHARSRERVWKFTPRMREAASAYRVREDDHPF